MSARVKLFVIGLGVFILMAFMLLNTLSHAGKVYASIYVLPEDATRKIEGKEVGGGIWLEPGTYRFSAEKQGFTKDEQVIRVSADTPELYLLPTPASNETRRWASQEAVSVKREMYAGLKASLVGENIRSSTPIIEFLPHYDIAAPYSIDYGLEENNHVYLLVGNSTPSGRVRALQWLRDKGFNPSELDIRFDDFNNPTIGARQ